MSSLAHNASNAPPSSRRRVPQSIALALTVATLLPYTSSDGATLDAARPGAIAVEPATPHSLGFRWPVLGDANGNARVDVAFRQRGDTEWRPAYPFFRVSPEYSAAELRVAGGVLFAGSIVDLEPDTAYEVRLALADPDGGTETRTVQARTTREPVEPPGLRVRYVVPERAGAHGGIGTQAQPFVGLSAALAAAGPGDVLELAPGTYVGAPFRVAQSGSPQRPLVIRGATPEAAVLDGNGAPVLFDVARTHDVWLEDLVFRGAGTLIRADLANRLVVRRNRFAVTHLGFSAQGATYAESSGFFVTDNTFVGTTTWPRSRGIEEVYAVIVTGAGHVVAFNEMRNVGDGIHNGDVGRLSASDFHNNEIEVATDDGIEADYSDTNVRVFRNRITNAYSGISAQPSNGGPLYFFRNAILNTLYSPFKLHNGASGVLLFHNTSVRDGVPFLMQPGDIVSNVVSRNNLFVGTTSPALASNGRMVNCDFDADGYAWGGSGFAIWNGQSYASPLDARMGGEIYARHGVASLFSGRLFASALAPPRIPQEAVKSAANDPRLLQDGGAIDQGVSLPNFNDGFAGAAPDLGCCEAGTPLPAFGPRRREVSGQTRAN